jgi:hypothetical protein
VAMSASRTFSPAQALRRYTFSVRAEGLLVACCTASEGASHRCTWPWANRRGSPPGARPCHGCANEFRLISSYVKWRSLLHQ